MKLKHLLLTSVAAGALVLAVGACVHDGDSSSATDETDMEMPDPAIAERADINTKITAARTAVAGLTDDASDAAINSAEMAVAAAKKAVADADNVPDAEKAAHNTTVATLESNLAAKKTSIMAKRNAADDAAEKASAADGKALHKALTANPLDFLDDDGAVSLGAGGLVVKPNGTADDTDGLASVTLKAGASAGSLGDWSGMNYAHMDTGTKVANSAVVYTNQGAATTKTFASEYGAGKPSADDGTYDADTRVLTLNAGGLSANEKKMASMFATAGTKTHTANVAGGSEVSFSGSYDGAQGTYSCVIAAGTPCTSSHGAAGITLAGPWKFSHASGAMVSRPDGNYLYFGWWLRKDDDGVPTHASAFASAMGTAGDATETTINLNTIQGPATYTGKAAGKFAMSNPLEATGSAGHFTANAVLTAKFGSEDDAGMTGTINGFMANGSSMPWSVELQRAAWGDAGVFASVPDDAGTADVDETTGTVWSINGNPAPMSGTWSGQAYDDPEDDTNVPSAVTGTFQSEFGSIGRMVGAFGAEHSGE